MDILDVETESNLNAGVADDVVVSDTGGGDAIVDADTGSATVTPTNCRRPFQLRTINVRLAHGQAREI
jgi:hypothetical protein